MASPRKTRLSNLSSLTQAAKSPPGRRVLTVDVDEVVSKPDQVRKRFRNIEELAASMKAEGQQSPVIVWPKNRDGKYVIQKGERRWRAAKHAELGTIDILINEKDQSALDETAGELIENIQRENLSPLEVANALQQFVDDNWKKQDIATRLGKSPSYVSAHLALLKLPDCVLDLYESEVTSDTETLNNLRLLYELDKEQCEELCGLARSQGVSRRVSRDALKTARNKAEQSGGGGDTSPERGVASKAPQAKSSASSSDKAASNDSEQRGNSIESTPPPAKGKKNGGTDLSTASNAESEWEPAQPDAITVQVNIVTGESIKEGILLLDRVSTDPVYAWVKIEATDGQVGKPVRVHINDIELKSIKGETSV